MRCVRNNPEIQHISLEVVGQCGAWTRSSLEELEEYASYCNPVLGLGNSLRHREIRSAVRNLQVSLYYGYMSMLKFSFLRGILGLSSI